MNFHTLDDYRNNDNNNNNNNNYNNINQNNNNQYRPVLMRGMNDISGNREDIKNISFCEFLKQICCPQLKLKSFIFIISCIDIIYYIITLIYGGILPDPTQLLPPTNEALDTFGMKVNYKIKNGQIWRWITYGLLHANFIHIFFNIFSQLLIGSIIEAKISTLKIGLLYLLVCISGGLFSSVANVNVNAVGASVSIFGLFSAYFGDIIINYHRLIRVDANTVFCNCLFMGLIIFANFSVGFANDRIDNYGHLGGLIFGFLWIFVLIRPFEEGTTACFSFKTWRIIAIVALALLHALLLILFFVL